MFSFLFLLHEFPRVPSRLVISPLSIVASRSPFLAFFLSSLLLLLSPVSSFSVFFVRSST